MKNTLALLCCLLLLLPSPSYASYCFGTTCGSSNTTDKIAGGTSVTLSSTFTWAGWINAETLSGADGSGFGTMLAIPASASVYLFLYTRNTNTSVAIQRSFSGADGAWRCPAPSLSVLAHLAFTYDSSSTANVPVMYLNGVSQTVTQITAPTGTADALSAVPLIGNEGDATSQFKGKIAEMALWNGVILTAAEIAALAHGVSPMRVHRAGLAFYTPLWRGDSRDLGPNHYTFTITGALPQEGTSTYPPNARP